MATIKGTPGDDLLPGTAGADTISGAGGSDTLSGSGGNDNILGGSGNDLLNGGAGADTVRGGAGNDTYIVNSVLDVVRESPDSGSDWVKSSVTWKLGADFERLTLTGSLAISGTGNGLANTIAGNSAANRLAGGAGNDELSGVGGNDTLNGGTGKDNLKGGAGEDRLDGGAGIDTLLGGGGNDLLFYDAADVKANGGGGTDTLKLRGSGVTLDLDGLAGGVLVNLERIDLTGSGDNTLVAAPADIVALSGSSDTVLVKGNAGDAVEASGSWGHVANVVVGGQTYAEYANGSAVLRVDVDAGRSGIVVSALSLGALDGTSGFRLDGIDAYDRSGFSVASAGDVNGDGFADLIVGALTADPGGDADGGEVYVVFGRASGFGSAIDLASLEAPAASGSTASMTVT